jgi:hypothetical protein
VISFLLCPLFPSDVKVSDTNRIGWVNIEPKLHLLNQIPDAAFLGKLTVTHLVKIFSFHRTRKFIIVFTKTNYWTLSGASPTPSTPSHHTSSMYCSFNDAVSSSDYKRGMVGS